MYQLNGGPILAPANRGYIGRMTETLAGNADVEIAYAVLKAGYRPFDCSRQAMRREALATLAGARKPANDCNHEATPAAIIDLGLERSRRDLGQSDLPR